MERSYQYNFSINSPVMYDQLGRKRKAKTMIAVLRDYFNKPLSELRLLDIGGSTGIIDSYLSDRYGFVIGIDIDEIAIQHAKNEFKKDNLKFFIGDALNLHFADNSFHTIICSQVYEHVPSAEKMLREIFRVLVPGGVCYFAATNRLIWNEPHYHLPLLSVIPRPLGHIYLKLANKGNYYHEQHFTYWRLKKLVRNFNIHDYTREIINNPIKYKIDYMLPPGSKKNALAQFISAHFPYLNPGYIWLLEKPLRL